MFKLRALDRTTKMLLLIWNIVVKVLNPQAIQSDWTHETVSRGSDDSAKSAT
jgi:hypothetical protein